MKTSSLPSKARSSIARSLRYLLQLFVGLLLLSLTAAAFLWRYYHPLVQRTDGIVYGTRHGHDLTMDIIRPAKGANGLAVAFMVSGGWKSAPPGSTPVWMMAPLLRRGYTVFAISHLSQPESTVMEIIEDMQKGVRHVRHHAEAYRIDPQRIGITGGSAGGHLSLMLATTGGPGNPGAQDPVDRASSAVQAVAIFYPVTDFLYLGDSTENPGDGGPPKSYVKAFGPQSTDPDQWAIIGRATSPIYHIHADMAPILIHHGDADTLTPLEQSQWFVDQALAKGCDIKLTVVGGVGHGWPSMFLDLEDFGRWFDRHLVIGQPQGLSTHH
jgi:acetyl esterase/lipase